MVIYDCHCHSEHSHDSKQTVNDIAEKALSLGFCGVAITNHYDTYIPELTPDLIERERLCAVRAIDEICAVRNEYEGRLELFCGVEIGSPFNDAVKSKVFTSDPRMDVVIGSAHAFKYISGDGTVHGYNPFKERDPDECDRIVEAYFTDIYRNIAFCDIDIVGHVSYLQRYIVKNGEAPYSVKRYIDACADIMRAAIARDIAVEINAKSIDLCSDSPFTELDFAKLYRELGGKLITVGTDSHMPEHFELAFKAGELLKYAGFENACYFKGRQPVFYSLD